MDFNSSDGLAAKMNCNFSNSKIFDLTNWTSDGCYFGTNETHIPERPPMPRGFNNDAVRTAHFVCLGIIIPSGFIFNILTFVVFATSRTLRKTTTGHYLIALAIADCLFLFGEFFRWLNTRHMDHLGWHVDFIERNNMLCKFVFFIRYSAKIASAWMTVVITFERFLTVAFPLKVSRLSTPRIAKVAICLTFLFSVLSGCFPFWTVGVIQWAGTQRCLVIQTDTLKHVYNVCSWIFLRVGSLFLPGLLIFVFAIIIAILLSNARDKRNRKLSTRSTASTGSGRPSANLERQLTTMLLAVATAFIVLRLPYTVSYYIYNNVEPEDTQQYETLHNIVKISDIFVSVNYAINFFLYCFCGSSFRKQVKLLCVSKKKRPVFMRGWSNYTSSSAFIYKNGTMPKDYGHKYELAPVNNGNKIMMAPYGDKQM